MNVFVITQLNGDVVTGGQYINQLIYKYLEKRNCRIIFSNKILNQKSNLMLLFSLMINVRRISKYDYVFIDSSLFPKTICFMLLFWLLGCSKKVCILHHHMCSQTIGGIKGLVYQIAEKMFLSMGRVILVFSPFVYDQTEKMFPKKKIVNIGLPFEKDCSRSCCRKKGKLLYVGTIEERKGLIYLIEAIALLSENVKKCITLNIVGKIVSKSYLIQLKELISHFKLDEIVQLHGRVEKNILEEFYDSSYAFVFPSLYEGFGMVVVEAMAHSLPVVAFNNTSMPYIVQNNQNGFLVKNKDAKAFSNAIAQLMNDEKLYNKLVQGAKNSGEKAQSYESFEKNIESFLSGISI